MENTNPNTKQVSGPINVIRLEGHVQGKKKVIYLFMDVHAPLPFQTECNNVFSKDVNKYFAKSFYKLNGLSTMYDFFLEIMPSNILSEHGEFGNRKVIYIFEVMKFFQTIFKYDRESNKVSVSENFQNVRLHYMDIRDYFESHIWNKLQTSRDIAGFNNYVNPNNILYILDQILPNIESAKKNLDIMNDIFKKTPAKPVEKKAKIKESQKEIDVQVVEDLVYKIKLSYMHDNVKNIINKQFDNIIVELNDLSNQLDETIRKFDDIRQTIKQNDFNFTKDIFTKEYGYGFSEITIRNFYTIIANTCTKNLGNCVNLFAKVTDLYFLRRFLDKDYITNAIVYTGSFHSANYIKILLQYFNFVITHIAYNSTDSIEQLNKEVHKILKEKDQDSDYIHLTPLIMPPTFNQCSDLTNFPENFS